MKINVNPRNNYLTSIGVLDIHTAWLDQSLRVLSEPTFKSLDITESLTVNDNLTVRGNLTVAGETTVISTEVVQINDNIILINAAETGSGVTADGAAGIEVERGSLANYRFVYEEASGYFKIGEIGSLEIVATRGDSPLDKGVAVFNNVLGTFDSTQTIELPMIFSSTLDTTETNVGSITTLGGVGIEKSLTLGGTLSFKSSGSYSTSISGDIGDNIIFNVPGGKNTSVPINTKISLDGPSTTKGIYADSNVNLYNDTGNFIFTGVSGGFVRLPVNTKLDWGVDNYINYTGVNLNIQTTGSIITPSPLKVTNVTPSTSSSIASVVFSGGLSVSLGDDSVSSLNGGGLTLAGGAGIAKKLHIGDKLTIAETATSVTQVINQGINFRSLSRNVTTTGAVNVSLNTFEGSNLISSVSIPVASTLVVTSPPSISGGGTIIESNALLVSSGSSRFDGRIISNETSSSSSNSIGSVSLKGGLSISNATNSTGVLQGGGITNAGGMSVAKDTYIGGTFVVSGSNVTTAQIADEGVSFVSKSRNITTTTTSNLTFNSFQAGNINTTAVVPLSSTVYISGVPTKTGSGTLQNNYALLVGPGASRFDCDLISTVTTASVSAASGSVRLLGGLGINNLTDASSSSNGGAFTTNGGGAFGKKLFAGSGVTTNTGIGIHNSMTNSGVLRFTSGIYNTESGSNQGSDFLLKSYNDIGIEISTPLSVKRSNGVVSLSSSVSSVSSTTGGLTISGGLGISNTTDSVSSVNGGSFTTSGGASILKSLYVGGNINVTTNLNVTGVSTLAQTSINTNTGAFGVSGSGNFTVNVPSTSFTSTAGINLNSGTTTSIQGTSSVSVITNAFSTSSVSNTLLSSAATSITSNQLNVNTSGPVNFSGTGKVSINTTDTVNGIEIGTSPNTNLILGNAISQVTVSDDLIVSGDLVVLGGTVSIETTVLQIDDNSIIINNGVSGTSDSGFLVRRFQNPNDSASGDVVNGIVTETGSFQSGSTTLKVVLSSSASGVSSRYVGWWIKITSGSGISQVRRIKDYNSTTKEATIFNTSDPDFGLNLTIPPVANDTYNLYASSYSGIIFKEASKQFSFASVSFDQSSGAFPQTFEYFDIHAKSLILEEGISTNGVLTVDTLNNSAFSVRGSNLDVFSVNTNANIVNLTNNSGTLTNEMPLVFNHKNSIGAIQQFSSVKSKTTANVPGSLSSNLILSVANGSSVPTELITLKGSIGSGSSFDISTTTTNITSTVSSTSNVTGGIQTSSGIGISNSTDAVNVTNGGSITTSGGVSIAKKLYVGGIVNLLSTVETSPTLNTQTTYGLKVLTDILSGSKLLFESSKGIPSFSSRSVGSRIVLDQSTTASSVDSAIGVSVSGVWYSGSSSSAKHSFYLGETITAEVTSSGISIPGTGNGVSFSTGSGSVKGNSTNDKLLLVSGTLGTQFTNTNGTSNTINMSPQGQLDIGMSNISSVSQLGSVLGIRNMTFTDNVTLSTQTLPEFSTASIKQTTLASSNSNVTTGSSSSLYIQGSVISGTNNTLTKSYSLQISNNTSITSSSVIQEASSLYVKGSPIASGSGVITNSYSILVDSGITKLQSLVCSSTNSVSNTSNSLSNIGVLISGDIVSQKKLIFDGANGVPSLTTRSSGVKLILAPNISASTVDVSIGNTSSSLWYAVSDTSYSHDFYFGNTLRTKISSDGITFTSSASEGIIRSGTIDGSDSSGTLITGGGSASSTRGAWVGIYGNEHSTQPGNLILNAGESGNVKIINSSGAETFSVDTNGKLVVRSTEETTGSSTGALQVLGGANIEKSLVVNETVTFDFNQGYKFSGDVTGGLNVKSQTTSVLSSMKLYSFDSDNTDPVNYQVYGNDNEFLSMGYTGSGYLITTSKISTGLNRPLVLSSSGVTSQVRLNTDTTVSVSSTTDSTSITTGALKVAGGLGVTKDLYVGGNVNTNILSPSIIFSNLSGITGNVVQTNNTSISNGNTRDLAITFVFSPSVASSTFSFDFVLPGITTNFTNSYTGVSSVLSGFLSATPFLSIENCVCFCVSGTTRVTIRGTSINTASHVLSLRSRYTI
jgi:hypothetical protein